jgi:uncharacterized protein
MHTITEPPDTTGPSHGAVSPTPPAEQPDARPAATRRHRRPMAVFAGCLIVIAATAPTVFDGADGADGAAPHTSSPLLDPAEGGVYRFDDGDELTLFGTQTRPRYELGATVVELARDTPDRFSARADEMDRIELERSNGRVTGLVHHRADGSVEFAERTGTYVERDVEFSSSGANLAGTVFVPTSPGPHPAVVIVHGAERATRETYRLLATHYARRGVAALIYDKRGLGASTGDVASATFDDLTDDALAGAELMRAHPDVDARRVGIAGFSQGGWLAALAADRDPEVAFVVAYSASGFSPADQNAWLYGNMLAIRGLDRRTVGIADRMARMLYSTVDLVDASLMPSVPHVPGFWFHALDLHLDSATLWERVEQPVLGIWGANDCQVPAHDSARVIARALAAGRNSQHSLVVVADADHGLTIAGPCEHELGLHHHDGRMDYAPEYLAGGANWILGLEPGGSDANIVIPDSTRHPDLAWHQSPPAPAPWHATAAVQLPMMLLLPIGFTAVAVATCVHRRRRRRTPGDDDRATARLRWGLIVGGLATLISGTAALIEITALGDLLALLLVGTGPISGTTPLLLGAGLVTTVTTVAAGLFAARLVGMRRRADAPTTRLDWCILALGTATVAWGWAWQFPLVTL